MLLMAGKLWRGSAKKSRSIEFLQQKEYVVLTTDMLNRTAKDRSRPPLPPPLALPWLLEQRQQELRLQEQHLMQQLGPQQPTLMDQPEFP
mmetsp:Transcript_7350/g.21176  ORF Transcript_7350/g.21176 Transcript_7350/m.21176 type:complete len:90 (+) Transcript_7350:48-317(+)